MNSIKPLGTTLYEKRCRCNEEFSRKRQKKKKSVSRSTGKTLRYPEPGNVDSTTFILSSENPLSEKAKLVLNSFQKKYFYHAVDDLLYFPNLNSNEKEKLLALIYSPILALQNYNFIDFFDVWVNEVYIYDVVKKNRFLHENPPSLGQCQQIKITLFYLKPYLPVEDEGTMWW